MKKVKLDFKEFILVSDEFKIMYNKHSAKLVVSHYAESLVLIFKDGGIYKEIDGFSMLLDSTIIETTRANSPELSILVDFSSVSVKKDGVLLFSLYYEKELFYLEDFSNNFLKEDNDVR